MNNTEAFESWARAEGFHDLHVDLQGRYVDDFLQHCFLGWEAATGESGQAWLLRKQAEAVQDFATHIKENHAEVMSVWILQDAAQYIQRLRQRADEIERGEP